MNAQRGIALLIVLAWASTDKSLGDSVAGWGSNDFGQVDAIGAGNVPEIVSALPGTVQIVSAGGSSSMAVINGAAYGWGNDGHGQLGNGEFTSEVLSPAPIANLSSGVTAITGGYLSSYAIQNGAAYAWGDSYYGELGNGESGASSIPSAVPVPVTNLSAGVTAISPSFNYCLAIQNGAAYSWGVNEYGQLGDHSLATQATPALVIGLSSGVTAISAGVDHALAIKNGAVYAWGNNEYGALGNGTSTNSQVPVPVPNLSTGVTAVAAGYQYSLAVQNRNVYGWGTEDQGVLGEGNSINPAGMLVPELIDPTDLSDIVAVAATEDTSFALSADGSIWDWGNNSVGQLGIGENSLYDAFTPQHLLAPAGYIFTSISAAVFGSGSDHVIATIQAVPEPSMLTPFGFGLVALTARMRKKAK